MDIRGIFREISVDWWEKESNYFDSGRARHATAWETDSFSEEFSRDLVGFGVCRMSLSSRW